MADYNHKVDMAIRLLRQIPKDGPVEISYSGGKDSDVILELAKMAGIDYRIIYKNTTIDPPGTMQHCRDTGAEIIQPRRSFLQIITAKGYPNTFRRFCCSELKEYKLLDRAVQGIRRDESTKRAMTYKEPEICRVYSKTQKTRVYLPILEWTAEDVARFIGERGIKCAPVYYDKDGNFHPERRLGCMCCPLKNIAARVGDFRAHKQMVGLYLVGGGRWLKKQHEKGKWLEFKDVYEYFTKMLWYSSVQDFLEATDGGLFGEANRIDCKKLIEDKLDYKVPDYIERIIEDGKR